MPRRRIALRVCLGAKCRAEDDQRHLCLEVGELVARVARVARVLANAPAPGGIWAVALVETYRLAVAVELRHPRASGFFVAVLHLEALVAICDEVVYKLELLVGFQLGRFYNARFCLGPRSIPHGSHGRDHADVGIQNRQTPSSPQRKTPAMFAC